MPLPSSLGGVPQPPNGGTSAGEGDSGALGGALALKTKGPTLAVPPPAPTASPSPFAERTGGGEWLASLPKGLWEGRGKPDQPGSSQGAPDHQPAEVAHRPLMLDFIGKAVRDTRHLQSMLDFIGKEFQLKEIWQSS